jgi:predicted nucleic acid-binding protein
MKRKTIVDTNVIVGFLVRREKLLEESFVEYDELVVPDIVVLEVVYVLEKQYGLSRTDISRVLIKILQNNKVQCERLILTNSLLKYSMMHQLSFADCYLHELADCFGCGLLTGDRDLDNYARDKRI